MVGRGTRRHPEKADCLVLDVVGATTRHDLVTLASLSGLDADVIERKAVTRALAENRPRVASVGTWAAELAATEVELFRRSPLAWVRSGQRHVLSAATGLIMLEPEGATWRVFHRDRDGVDTNIARGLSLEWAQGTGEDVARQAGAAMLVDRSAPWRSQPATERQLDTLRRMKMRPRPGLTKGEASDLISQKIGGRSA